jgi:hypothetical protein
MLECGKTLAVTPDGAMYGALMHVAALARVRGEPDAAVLATYAVEGAVASQNIHASLVEWYARDAKGNATRVLHAAELLRAVPEPERTADAYAAVIAALASVGDHEAASQIARDALGSPLLASGKGKVASAGMWACASPACALEVAALARAQGVVLTADDMHIYSVCLQLAGAAKRMTHVRDRGEAVRRAHARWWARREALLLSRRQAWVCRAGAPRHLDANKAAKIIRLVKCFVLEVVWQKTERSNLPFRPRLIFTSNFSNA